MASCSYLFRRSKIKGIILEHTTYTNPTKTSILSGLLTSIQNPILKPLCWIIIAGADKDRLTKLEASVTLNKAISGSKLVVLSPAGHMGLIEQHAYVNQHASEFLRSTG
ncbi:MAG: alpha/beta hydrolase [Pedobacter sp.]|jgi:homoserine acetyltransferase|nr:alpha/beta hydrolase [Pedobacter sp.]